MTDERFKCAEQLAADAGVRIGATLELRKRPCLKPRTVRVQAIWLRSHNDELPELQRDVEVYVRSLETGRGSTIRLDLLVIEMRGGAKKRARSRRAA